MWNAKYSNSSHPYANSALHQTWIFTSGQSPDWVVTLIALPMLRPEQLLSGEECLAWQISLQVLSPIKLQKKKFMGNCKTTTTLTPDPQGQWRLDGTKYYSTGTLYASWIVAIATDGTDRIQLVVPADAPGVTRVDDWDGFGQRLTGSGTTHFKNVAVPDDYIINRTPLSEFPTNEYFTTYYQLFHLATLAGIGRAIVRDAVAFVRPRTRTFGVPGQVAQRHDPLVQGVVGRLSALSFSADTLVDRVAWALEAVFPQWAAGHESGPAFDTAQVQAYQAQQIVAGQVLEAATLLFEVGGASATSTSRRLDRHWRNARTLASHNPLVQRQRELGDLVLNGTAFGSRWRDRAGAAAPSVSTSAQQEHAA